MDRFEKSLGLHLRSAEDSSKVAQLATHTGHLRVLASNARQALKHYLHAGLLLWRRNRDPAEHFGMALSPIG
jgi:hypothetical protein